MYGFPEEYEFNKRIDFEDVRTLERLHTRLMLDRTRQMFTWKGLPKGFSEKWLEIYLQIHGYVIACKTPQGIKFFFGGLGNVLDEYYKPTEAIIANPFLNYYETLHIWREYHEEEFNEDNDCIICSNDTLQYGLLPLISKYAHQLSTNEITLNVADINSRAMNVLAAKSENAFESIKEFLKDLKRGKIAHIRESMIHDEDVRSLPFSNETNNGITNLIELQQYYKASFYNEIGLNANYNMKRESIQQNESDMNHDSLKPLIDDMLECRQDFCDWMNSNFGLNMSVEFNSIWAERELMEVAAIDAATDPEPEEVPEEPTQEESEEVEESDPDRESE